jgi:hypothetical protein
MAHTTPHDNDIELLNLPKSFLRAGLTCESVAGACHNALPEMLLLLICLQG